MTIAELDALYAAATAAFDAADYTTALAKALSLQFRLDSMPDVEQDLGPGGRRKLAFSRRNVTDLISLCKKLKHEADVTSRAASYLFQQTTVTYERPDSTDDYS